MLPKGHCFSIQQLLPHSEVMQLAIFSPYQQENQQQSPPSMRTAISFLMCKMEPGSLPSPGDGKNLLPIHLKAPQTQMSTKTPSKSQFGLRVGVWRELESFQECLFRAEICCWFFGLVVFFCPHGGAAVCTVSLVCGPADSMGFAGCCCCRMICCTLGGMNPLPLELVLGLAGLMIFHSLLLCLPNKAEVDNLFLLGIPVPTLSRFRFRQPTLFVDVDTSVRLARLLLCTTCLFLCPVWLTAGLVPGQRGPMPLVPAPDDFGTTGSVHYCQASVNTLTPLDDSGHLMALNGRGSTAPDDDVGGLNGDDGLQLFPLGCWAVILMVLEAQLGGCRLPCFCMFCMTAVVAASPNAFLAVANDCRLLTGCWIHFEESRCLLKKWLHGLADVAHSGLVDAFFHFSRSLLLAYRLHLSHSPGLKRCGIEFGLVLLIWISLACLMLCSAGLILCQS
ncbi:hypothetical protein Nepgr_021061 [Nepenthes gracilis]|uniref:Uncharacterized protein n=1 Tax=Nepenthes gracilis TaxID=150966 RepID=A0AAD3SWK8_NEPGR|nr:hypothetical protein Nepgr_021061 [Nepenthes gracilis]